VTSPNGVLLFREVSKVITCYGEHILTLSDIPAEKLYDLKYPYTLREEEQVVASNDPLPDVWAIVLIVRGKKHEHGRLTRI